MRTLHGVLGFLSSVSMLIILLITSFEIGAYSDFEWYEKEYDKYGVLVVNTVVDGEEREFFNDREKAHMVDVKNLFIGGLWLRRGAILGLGLTIALLIVTKANLKRLLPKSFLIGMVSFIGVTVAAGILFMSDFNKYFTIFHELFFTNDLWLLDLDTDLLIRMLPEGFFLDMVIRIGSIFLILMTLLLIISVLSLRWNKIRKTNKSL